MTPIIFIISVSLVLMLMLYWILRDFDRGRRRQQDNFQFETAQELFNYVDEDVYLGENHIELIRPEMGRVQALWNFSQDKWAELCGVSEQKKKTREPYLRFYQASEQLRTFDMSLRNRSGHQDFDLPANTACYFSIGYKENGRFFPVMTSRTLMRQC